MKIPEIPTPPFFKSLTFEKPLFKENMVSAYLDTGLDSFLDEVSDNLFKLGSGQLQVHVLGA